MTYGSDRSHHIIAALSQLNNSVLELKEQIAELKEDMKTYGGGGGIRLVIGGNDVHMEGEEEYEETESESDSESDDSVQSAPPTLSYEMGEVPRWLTRYN